MHFYFHGRSERVFQNGYCWVDMYKLSLLMMRGGWIHFHVMDCFSKMLSSHQKLIANVEGHIFQYYFEQNVVVSIMYHTLLFFVFLITLGI